MQHLAFRVVFSGAAFAVLGFYLFGPEAITGRFDMMALGLMVLVALPWLGALVEEFKIGGIEAKLRAIREEAAEAADAATEAREVAEEAILSRSAPAVAPPSVETSMDADPMIEAARLDTQPPSQDDPLAELEALAQRYLAKRDSMSKGALRTAATTSIFGDMQRAAMALGADHAAIQTWIASDDPGRQLAAIAWLREFPAACPPATFIRLIERATHSFVQYWGLRALSGRIDALGTDEFSIADRVRLKEIRSLVPAGTDRSAQIKRIDRKLAGDS